jgi:rhodanese-related sulfurtransferase
VGNGPLAGRHWSPTTAWIHFDPFSADGAVHNKPGHRMKFRNKKVTVLIDVRSRLEFFFGHMPGAIRIPMRKINATTLEGHGIPRDAGILVYCASGSRSALAVRALKQAGYTRVMDGGGLAEVRKNLTED